MKKTLILLFSFLFIFASTFPVKASEIQSINSTNIIEIFDDGSYIESSTEENIVATLSRSSSTKSAKRTYTYKTSSGKILWTITVTGTFTYNGSSSSCTKASVSTTCPLLLNWLQNQQQSTTPLQLRLLHLNSTMIQYI